ncbi:TIGR03757 family integrating conjugative element protein [Endozoicomonas sp. ALC066]|uniref:TIGR03757 family integrating conjugative element protein n=1 Tax=Endozoicomonas sp. ALC066 TaxID=3403078 RepID=UPI003BB6EB31
MRLLAIPLLLTASMSWANVSIEVFTNDRFPVSNSDHKITYYNLDDRQRAQMRLPKNLPADLAKAKQVASQYMQTADFRKTVDALKNAYQGYIAALDYQLAKLPAIVIDGEYILYGVTSVDKALALYEQYQEREGQ